MSNSIYNRSHGTLECNNSIINGSHNTIIGNNNTINGSKNKIYGNNNTINGSKCEIFGDNNILRGSNNKTDGNNNTNTSSSSQNSFLNINNDVFNFKNFLNDELFKSKININKDISLINNNIVDDMMFMAGKQMPSIFHESSMGGGGGGNIVINNFGTRARMPSSSAFSGNLNVHNSFNGPRVAPSPPRRKPARASKSKKPTLEKKDDEKTDNDSEACIICTEYKKCVLYTPCNHLASCNTCAQKILSGRKRECPLCRVKIETLTHVFV